MYYAFFKSTDPPEIIEIFHPGVSAFELLAGAEFIGNDILHGDYGDSGIRIDRWFDSGSGRRNCIYDIEIETVPLPFLCFILNRDRSASAILFPQSLEGGDREINGIVMLSACSLQMFPHSFVIVQGESREIDINCWSWSFNVEPKKVSSFEDEFITSLIQALDEYKHDESQESMWAMKFMSGDPCFGSCHERFLFTHQLIPV